MLLLADVNLKSATYKNIMLDYIANDAMCKYIHKKLISEADAAQIVANYEHLRAR